MGAGLSKVTGFGGQGLRPPCLVSALSIEPQGRLGGLERQNIGGAGVLRSPVEREASNISNQMPWRLQRLKRL
jgi:hypothetical protein